MAGAPKSYENFNSRRPSTSTPYPKSATEGSAFFNDADQSPKDVSASKSRSKPSSKKENGPPPDVLPPDVAEARMERINKELVAMLKKRHDPRARRKPLQGNGTYTHIDHPDPSREPIFVSLNEERNTGRDAALEALIDPDVQRAYDVLKQALEEANDYEEEMYRTKKHYDIYQRYGALPIPVAKRRREETTPPPQPPPPRLDTHVPPSSDRDIRSNFEGGETWEPRSGQRDKGSASSFAHDPPRRDSIAMDIAMGKISGDGGRLERKGSLTTPVTPIAPSLAGTTYDASRDPRRQGR